MKQFWSKTRLTEIIIWIVLVILISVTRTADLGRFLGFDEKMRNRQSLDSFLAIAEGRWGDVYSAGFGGTNLTWARTVAKLIHFGWLRLRGFNVSLPEMVNYGPQFDPLPNAIFNILLVVITYWFARKLLGWKTAALATAMLALDPYLLSEARILRTEAAFAVCFTLSLLSIAIYASTRQRRYLVWCGFWVAWTFATKISGALLAPIVGGTLLVMFWPERPTLRTIGHSFKCLLVAGLICGGAALATTFTIWPTLWVKPLQTFIDLYQFVFHYGVESKTRLVYFYLGDIVHDLPVSYYLLVLLYKTTPLVWLGLGAFGWALWQQRKAGPRALESTWLGFPFPVAGGLIVLLGSLVHAIAMAMGAWKTERYMMASVATLDITAAIGLALLATGVYHRWVVSRWSKSVFWLTAATVFVAGLGLLTWLNHPYYFSYYNPLLGGGRAAVNLVQVGSGEGVDMAMDYLAHQPNPNSQVVLCGTNLPRCEYLSAGQTFLKEETFNSIYGDWIKADYVVTYIFQTQRRDYPPGIIAYLEKHPGPVYTATFPMVQGIEYATVYPGPRAQYVAASKLTGISTLLGYTLDRQNLAAGDSLNIKLYWENDGRIERDMFVRLVDDDNYVWSETSAPFAPGFAGLEAQRGAIIVGQANLPIPVGTPPGRYYLKMGYKTETGQLVGLFQLPTGGDTLEIVLPEVFTSSPSPSHLINLDIDSNLTLTGYELDRNQAAPGEPVWLTLFWQVHANVQRDYVINVRLLDGAGKELTYWLGRPVRSGYPTNTWRAGQIVQDPWRLTLPADIRSGEFQLDLRLFDAETKQEVKQVTLQPLQVGH